MDPSIFTLNLLVLVVCSLSKKEHGIEYCEDTFKTFVTSQFAMGDAVGKSKFDIVVGDLIPSAPSQKPFLLEIHTSMRD